MADVDLSQISINEPPPVYDLVQGRTVTRDGKLGPLEVYIWDGNALYPIKQALNAPGLPLSSVYPDTTNNYHVRNATKTVESIRDRVAQEAQSCHRSSPSESFSSRPS